MAQLCLDAVELGVELLKVGERSQMHSLNIVADIFIAEEVFDNCVAQFDLLNASGGLLQPLFEQSATDLSPSLVQKAKQTATLTRDTRVNSACLREDVERFEGRNVQAKILTQSVLFEAELLLSGIKLLDELHVDDSCVQSTQGKVHLRLNEHVREVLLQEARQGLLNVSSVEVFLTLREREVDFTHLQGVLDLFPQHFVW